MGDLELAALFAKHASPATPLAAVQASPDLTARLAHHDRLKAGLMIAGLFTDSRHHAHLLRLDWALRLVLGLGAGRRTLSRQGLHRLLNSDLSALNVAQLEDPPENVFVDRLATGAGDVLFFSGYQDKPRAYTELVMSGFAMLPDGAPKHLALSQCEALLRLGHAVIVRRGLEEGEVGGGAPFAAMSLPSEQRLATLARGLAFSNDELHDLGIDARLLAPFFMRGTDAESTLSNAIGNAPIDLRPLIKIDGGLAILAPHTLTTAVRGWLIDRAVHHGLGDQLQYRMLCIQNDDIDESGFLRTAGVPVTAIAGRPGLSYLDQVSQGRFVHVIETIDDFSAWPSRSFGSTAACDEALVDEIARRMDDARKAAQTQDGYQQGMTVWLAGGWGAARSVPASLFERFDDWPLLLIEPADAVVMGLTPGGKLRDIWRLELIRRRVEDQGFSLTYANGALNLFQWWKDTDLALVPPQSKDIAPPITINFDTNLLLRTRVAAAKALDRRSLPHPVLGWLVVSRLERQTWSGPLEPIYASMEAVRQGDLLGAAAIRPCVWWVRFGQTEGTDRETAYQTWNAALIWAHRVLPAFIAAYPGLKAPYLHFELSVAQMPDQRGPRLDDSQIDAAAIVRWDAEDQVAYLDVGLGWHQGLHRADNRAEIALAAAMMEGALQAEGLPVDRQALIGMALGAAGSSDYRFRHSFEVERAIDALRGNGLATKFRPLSESAGALEKCGSVWKLRSPDDGLRIEGKTACASFLKRFINAALEDLRGQVRRFDRTSLIVSSLNAIQAALSEQRNWDATARALRAIHGVEEDHAFSLDQTNRINGVLRTCSILAEMANAESPKEGGLKVGLMDLEELQAKTLAAFYAGDMSPALHTDRLQPAFRFSPTGDLMTDHQFSDLTLKASAQRRHRRERERSSDSYADRFDRADRDRKIEADLEQAMTAEYGVPHATWRELSMALAGIALERGQGVFKLRRSEVLAALAETPGLETFDFAPLIARLTSWPRRGWDDLPQGARPSDFDLAKFDRRFSLISRSILALDDGQDPELVIAPAVVERGLAHNIGGAMTGTLQNEFWTSAPMRKFASQAGARAGIEFNQDVADALSSLGLRTWPSCLPSWCLNTKKTPEVAALGDVDVLALSPNGRVVWVIEAKDLKLCRTLGEVSRRLSEYRGLRDEKGRPDALLKHLRRVAYLREHAAGLMRRLGLDRPQTECGAVVVRSPQPMSQLSNEYLDDARVVMLDDVGEIPWSVGWTAPRRAH